MSKPHFHRRNLPHLYYNEGIYFITYRIYASIHQNELNKIHQLSPSTKSEIITDSIFKKYDYILDKSSAGEKYLQIPEVASICRECIHYPDGQDYKLLCYTIMPNHVHQVFELLNREKLIGDIMGAVKRNSAKQANKFLKREGAFWQAESYDRLVRNEKELYFIIRYVLMNPVNAGLVEKWNDWEYTYCRENYIVI